MAGTLILDTIKSSTTSPPAFQNTSGTQIGTLCRAWVNFNGTGTVAINASFNVSSITDNGTGNYTVNFTNAMADANYSAVGTVQDDNDSSSVICTFYSSAFLTSSVTVRSINSGGTAVDSPTVCVSVFR